MSLFVLIPRIDNPTRWRITLQNGQRYNADFPNKLDNYTGVYDGGEHLAPYVVVTATDLEGAEAIAHEFSSRRAGVTWLVCPVSSAFVAPAAAPTKLVVNDKGIYPA